MDQVVAVIFVTAGVIWSTLDNASSHTSVRLELYFFFFLP